MKMTSRKQGLILLAALICIAAIISIVRYQLGKTYFNDTYVNGNTGGNLYNAGLFCESGDLIFFSNPADEHKLYSMTTAGTNVKKLCDDTVSYINADTHYVYYVRDNSSDDSAFSFLKWNNNSLCRIKRDGGDVVVLDKDPSLYASLVGNYVYYIHYDKSNASTLYRVKIDGKEKQQIHTSPILPCSTSGAYIYYNGIDTDHAIYRMDTSSNSSVLLYDGICYSPVVIGDIAYYLDAANNYTLTRTDLMSGETVTLTEDRVDCFNIAGSFIYYQRNSESSPALCRIGTAGGESEEIIPGNYTDINITSNYVYFYPYNNSTTCYRCPTTGGSVTQFFPNTR